MKNTKLALILLGVGTVGFLLALYFHLSRAPLELYQIVVTALVLVFVPLSALTGLRTLRKQKAGEPVEDELSRRMKDKAASRSFVMSLYMWGAILLITASASREVSLSLLAGIGGMLGVFLVNWAILNKDGVEE